MSVNATGRMSDGDGAVVEYLLTIWRAQRAAVPGPPVSYREVMNRYPLALSVLLAACTSDGTVGGSGVGSATGGASGDAGAGGAGASCTNLVNVGPLESEGFNPSESLPKATGGAIAAGTYALTSVYWYMGSSPSTGLHSYTMRITGSQIELVGYDSTGPTINAVFASTSDAATGAFDMVSTCPAGGMHFGAVDHYAATPTELHLLESTKVRDFVFTRM